MRTLEGGREGRGTKGSASERRVMMERKKSTGRKEREVRMGKCSKNWEVKGEVGCGILGEGRGGRRCVERGVVMEGEI